MDFTGITINEKTLFDKYIRMHNPQASEFTFTNFFMWRYYYNFKYTLLNDYLCVVAFPKEMEPYALTPIGKAGGEKFTRTVLQLKEYFNKNGWELKFSKVAESDLAYFRDIVKSQEQIVYDRDNSDYVYLTEELISLKGKKFHAKRNHINKFKSKYEYEYVPLDNGLVGECIRIMEDWCKARNCECRNSEYCERHANMEVLNNYDMLDCKGALIKVNGRFEAFTVGEMLNSDTAVIHIEKASFAVDGLYAFINQQFCENEWKHATYINREQDLGQEGLRKAKLSYNPVKMVNKYTVIVG